MKKAQKIHAWIISDGTKGMENQSIALAKLLNVKFHLIKFSPPFFLKKFPQISKFTSLSVIKEMIMQHPCPTYIITTGRRMAGISIICKLYFKDKVKTIHIQNPKISLNNFDLILLPEHDRLIGKNIITTKGALSFFNNQEIEEFPNSYYKENKNREKIIIFLMVGGNNKRYNPTDKDYYDLGMKTVKATKEINGKLLISTSRRTPKKAVKILELIFRKHLDDFEFVNMVNENPYPKILKITNYVIVTSDSVNMISENATTKIPLFISFFPQEKGKIYNFVEDLENLGVIKKFDGKLYNYKKNTLETNGQTILKINKFFGIH